MSLGSSSGTKIKSSLCCSFTESTCVQTTHHPARTAQQRDRTFRAVEQVAWGPKKLRRREGTDLDRLMVGGAREGGEGIGVGEEGSTRDLGY